jgi:hypothetical protein
MMSVEKISGLILNTIASTIYDGSVIFKAGACNALAAISTVIGPEVTNSKLMPILMDMMKEDNADIKMEVLDGLE